MSEIILKNGYELSLQSEFLFIFLNSEASTEKKVVKDIHKNQSFWYRPLIGDKTLKYNELIIIIIIIIQELILRHFRELNGALQ